MACGHVDGRHHRSVPRSYVLHQLHSSQSHRDQQPPKLHKFCLYFLVCKAETGSLSGLFKLGISDCLARRHNEHRRHWEEFDFDRSVVVRAESREEVQHIETTLRHAYGAPKLEAMAKAAGRTLTSEELIAAGSCRRNPGRRAKGWTEFYTMECFGDAVETLEHLVGRRTGCKVDIYLQRGITLAELALDLAGSDDVPLGPARGLGSATRKKAFLKRERDELDRRVEAKIGEVLDFAFAHEHDLRWVNLDWWHKSRAEGSFGVSSSKGLVDLYFGPFGSTEAGIDAWSNRRSAAQVRFEESFACIDPVAAPIAPHRWRWIRPKQVCDLRPLHPNFDHQLPHPVCAGTLLLRVEPELSDLGHPLFGRFVALAQRAENRLAREQMELC